MRESTIKAKYNKIRDIILDRSLRELTILGPQLKALYNARCTLLSEPNVRKIGGVWEVRGSPQGVDEHGRRLYVWHAATPQHCTCAQFYGVTALVTCEHRMIAWLLEDYEA